MINYEYVFFDCDGTLVDSEVIAMRVAGEVLLEAIQEQVPDFSYDLDEFVQKYAGWHFDQMIKVESEAAGVELDVDAVTAIKTDQTLTALEDVEIIPGIAEAIDTITAQGAETALVSSSELNRVNVCREATGLDVYFPPERTYSAHDSLPEPDHKPSPAIYEHALEKEGVSAANTATVEDSNSGVKSAVAANIDVVGFVGATHIPEDKKAAKAEELIKEGANLVIWDMRDLVTVLENLKTPEKINQAELHGNIVLPNDASGLNLSIDSTDTTLRANQSLRP